MIYFISAFLIVENFILLFAFRGKLVKIFQKIRAKKCCYKFEDKNASYYSTVPMLILHGAGGLNSKKYNNSKEGIIRGISEGYRIIEVDIGITSDGILVLTHRFQPDEERIFDVKPTFDEFIINGVPKGETGISLSDFFNMFSRQGTFFLLDCEHGTENLVIKWIKENKTREDCKNIIFQVHTLKMLKKVYKESIFDNIHYNGSSLDIAANLNMLRKCNVHTCSIADEEISENNIYLRKIINSGLHVMVYTINHMRRFNRVLELGVSGCFSDFLVPNQIEESKKVSI